ncbi:MAG: serine/threonine protein kinase [bacterium]|nr:serine/threonine protein kinase [bacterium]
MTERDDDRLEELLAEFVERRERGELLTAHGFAAQHPELNDQLQPLLVELERTAALLPAGDMPPFLGPYRIEARLGSGGTGEVFAARADDGREVAIKCLLPHVRLQPRAIERLRREGAVLESIDHPGIVRVEAFGEADGNVFLVMEHVDGGSLADALQQARERRVAGSTGAAASLLELPGAGRGERRAIELVAGLARALAVAHSRGLLHRDLKPGNVLLRGDGSPVLVDFGLAFDPEADTLTKTGDVLGTPNYMAPEQALGRAATEQSDVYGLAAILYELVTLRPPHQGGDALQVLSAVRATPPRPARAVEPSVSPALERVLRRALAHNPPSRWQSASEFAAALEALLAGERPQRATISLHQRVGEFWLWHKRGVLLAAAVVVLGIATIATMQALEAAQADRLATAIEEATIAYLDDGRQGRERAGTILLDAGAEPALARWLTTGETGDDPFLQAFARGVELRRQNPGAAVPLLRDAFGHRPDLVLSGAMLGIAAGDARDYELAERELVAAGRRLQRCVRVRRELGTVRRRRHDAKGAALAWREVVAIDATNPRYFYELARVEIQAKNGAAALAAIDQAIALHERTNAAPAPTRWLHVKGAALDQLDRRDEGIELLKGIIARKPTSATWHSLGLLYDKEHRLQEARAAYRAGLRLDDRSAPCIMSLAWLLAGSDRSNCQQCAECFEADPGLFDPDGVEQLALQMIRAQHGEFRHVEPMAQMVKRVGGGAALRQRLDALLEEEFSDAALGRLLSAKRALR